MTLYDFSSVLSLVLLVLTVFGGLLAIVAMVKVIQIAEDIRHKRHIEEGGVKAPRPYWVPVVVCLVFAVLLVALIIVYGVSLPIR